MNDPDPDHEDAECNHHGEHQFSSINTAQQKNLYEKPRACRHNDPADHTQHETSGGRNQGIGHIGSEGIVDHLLHIDDSHEAEAYGDPNGDQKQDTTDAQSKYDRRYIQLKHGFISLSRFQLSY